MAEVVAAEGSHPEFVVLDSNVIIADYWLRSPSAVLLFDFLKKTGAKLVVPQIVFEEVLNHHQEAVQTLKSEMQSGHRQAGSLLRKVQSVSGQVVALHRSNQRDPYPDFLAAELKRVDALVIDYKDIPHKDVVTRDLKRSRPFQQSGTGYRDTLLWEAIIRHCVKKGAVTVFLTDNVKDFCNAKGELHEDLRKDIQAKGADEKDFKLFRNLVQFTDALVVPYLKTRKDFAILITNKGVPGLDLERVCEDNLDAIKQAIDLSPGSMINNPGQYEPKITEVSPDTFNITAAWELSQNTLVVIFEVRASIAFYYFLPHDEYALMSEQELTKISIEDAEWNEYVMRVLSVGEIDLKCRLTFDTVEKMVESFEVESVKRVEAE